MFKLFLLFTLVPFVELYLLLRLSDRVGFMVTLGLVLATGVVGAAMARAEGMRVVHQWQRALSLGQLPADGVISGLLVLVGGVLLVTPGMTDAVGFCLLLPGSRRLIARTLEARLARAIERGDVRVVDMSAMPLGRRPGSSRGPEASGRHAGGRGPVIDTEGEPVEPDEPDEPRG